MYERFTDRSRKVMQLSQQEAQRFNHEYIGTEHLILGLIKEGSGVGANVLKNLDIDLRKVRLEVEKIVQSGPDMVTMGKLPLTPRTKKVIEYAIESAREFNHNYVGTEHLLIGLMREREGVGYQVLVNLGVDPDKVVAETKNLLGYNFTENYRSMSEKRLEAVSNQDFEEAAKIRDKLRKVVEDAKLAATGEIADLLALYVKGKITHHEFIYQTKKIVEPFDGNRSFSIKA